MLMSDKVKVPQNRLI